jgi:hypothetical protein
MGAGPPARARGPHRHRCCRSVGELDNAAVGVTIAKRNVAILDLQAAPLDVQPRTEQLALRV